MKPHTTTEKSNPAIGTTLSEQDILNRAKNVDGAIGKHQAAGQLEAAMTGDPAAAAQPAGPDPVMVQTLKVIVDLSVKTLHRRFEWSDPGDDWQNAVSDLSARLIDKYLPGIAAQQTEEIALIVIVAPWLIENLTRKKNVENDETPNVEKNVEVTSPTLPVMPDTANPIYEVQTT